MVCRTGLTLAAVVFLAFAPGCFARPQRGGGHAFGHTREGSPRARAPRVQTPIDRFEGMSPEQQRRALDRLPIQQRQRVQERLRKFNALPPEQQQALKNLYSRLHQLPPHQEDAVRKAIGRFSELSTDRQDAIKEQLRTLSPLSESDRESRLKSDSFHHDLSRKEQGIVKDMLPLFTSN